MPVRGALRAWILRGALCCMIRAQGVPYRRRALTYRGLDQQLARQTRFFAAAACVCESLARLSSLPASVAAGGAVRRFLAALSADLHAFNLHVVFCLEGGAEPGRASAESNPEALDRLMVRIEQDRVQALLDELRGRDFARYRRLTRRIDRLLRFAAHAPPRFDAADPLSRILNEVERRIGRAPLFACRADREAIGFGIVACLRFADCPQGTPRSMLNWLPAESLAQSTKCRNL